MSFRATKSILEQFFANTYNPPTGFVLNPSQTWFISRNSKTYKQFIDQGYYEEADQLVNETEFEALPEEKLYSITVYYTRLDYNVETEEVFPSIVNTKKLTKPQLKKKYAEKTKKRAEKAGYPIKITKVVITEADYSGISFEDKPAERIELNYDFLPKVIEHPQGYCGMNAVMSKFDLTNTQFNDHAHEYYNKHEEKALAVKRYIKFRQNYDLQDNEYHKMVTPGLINYIAQKVNASCYIFDITERLVLHNKRDKNLNQSKPAIALMVSNDHYYDLSNYVRHYSDFFRSNKRHFPKHLTETINTRTTEIIDNQEKMREMFFFLVNLGQVPVHKYLSGNFRHIQTKTHNYYFEPNKKTLELINQTENTEYTSFSSAIRNSYKCFQENQLLDNSNLTTITENLDIDTFNLLNIYKPRAIVGKYDTTIAGLKAIDINKAYSAALRDLPQIMIFQYSFFDFQNIPTDIIPGLYLVDSTNYELFQYQTVCSHETLKLAQKHNIPYKIIAYMKPSLFQPNTINQNYVNYVYQKYPQNLAKDIINRNIGMMISDGSKRVTESKFSSNPQDAIRALEQGYRVEIITDNNNHYFEISKTVEKSNNNLLSLYIQILDQNRRTIFEQIQKIPSDDLVAIRSDCIVFKETSTYKHQNSTKIGEFKLINDFTLPEINLPKYKPVNITSPYKQSSTLKEIRNLETFTQGLCTFGPAGSGKTTLIQQLKELHQNKLLTMSFTNKASSNISGSTVHRAFPGLKYNKQTVQNYSAIVVDEFSMIPVDIYKLLYTIKINHPEMPFYLFGDVQQYKPVEKYNQIYFRTPMFDTLVNHQYNELITVHRNKDFDAKELVQKMLNNQFKEITPKSQYEMVICYKNSTKDSENLRYTHAFINTPTANCFKLICKVNNKKLDLNNGDFWILNYKTKTVYKQNNPKITFNEDINWKTKKTAINSVKDRFDPGFAITSHKTQGETLSCNYIIKDLNYFLKKEHEGLYVVLSRAKKIDQILNIQFS